MASPRVLHLPPAASWLLAALALAPAGVATADQVEPPRPTGCADGLTQSDTDPAAQLPPTMEFHSRAVRVAFRLRNVTQTTRVTLRAYLLDGRRADAMGERTYMCTRAAAENYNAFDVKPGLVGGAIRRHGTLKLQVVLRLVNANGRRTVLQRVVTVTRPPSPCSGVFTTRPFMGRGTGSVIVGFQTRSKGTAAITVRLRGSSARARTIGSPADRVHQAFFTSGAASRLRSGSSYPVRFTLQSGSVRCVVTHWLYLHRRFAAREADAQRRRAASAADTGLKLTTLPQLANPAGVHSRQSVCTTLRPGRVVTGTHSGR